MKPNSSVIPTLQYKDAKAAIAWLCEAFGFHQHLVFPGENDTIIHAQLTFGNSMIMISSENDNEYGSLLKSPQDVGGFNTQSPYIIVEAIDEHYKKAVAAGAKILIDLKEEDYGGKAYTCQDPEGHVWNFGTYNPWKQ